MLVSMVNIDPSQIRMGDVPTWLSTFIAAVAASFVVLTLHAQRKQLKLQQDALDEETRRRNEEKLTQYVDKFSFWAEDALNPKIHFVNSSVHPIKQLTLHVTTLADQKQEMVSGSDGQFLGISSIPQGKWFYALKSAYYNVELPMEVHFVDSAGVAWRKTSTGEIHTYSRRHRYPDKFIPTPQIDE